ncbi:glycine betaine/proline transport system substrate-binding protein [Limimonas halophila]|uniref:Glycine betaine/proline transport system substrate-binding protein n=1 Tax=Limimonas halophila TaxID=1082479 RepID=A0A1G7L3W1_9PROT|nr:glycine betaine/proline transport system substrate-binding protein [Limimonas halophila]
MKRSLKFGLALAAGVSVAGAAQAQEVMIGHTTWTSNLITTHIVKTVLEQEMDREVQLMQVDPAPLYKGVASGDVDFHTVGWLPSTHSDYYKDVNDDVISMGAIYTRARLGWIVPAYVPEDKISSIPDLKKDGISEKLDGTITGIGPGAGLTRLSKKAMDDYGLKDAGYELEISSGAGMTSSVKRAIDNEEWIVATSWSPHWMFGRWDLRYIEDPKKTLGKFEHVDIIAREGFYQDDPEVGDMLYRMQIPIADVQAAMYDAEESSYSEAAQAYVDANADRVDYWVSGEMQ